MFKPENALRHEIKLLMSYADYLLLSRRLSAVLEQDKYSVNGDYFIRSLYLDDIYHSSYYDKLAGIQDRKKYRIRCYNNSDASIKLECKEKHGARICKTSVQIDRNTYDDILSGDYSSLEKREEPLCKEVLSIAKSRKLKPSIIVDYDREAYVYPISSVRLTFDKNLQAGISSYDMFSENLITTPIFPNQSVIFEVKYNDFIPTYISNMISQSFGSKLALSKFVMCREKLMEVKFYE